MTNKNDDKTKLKVYLGPPMVDIRILKFRDGETEPYEIVNVKAKLEEFEDGPN